MKNRFHGTESRGYELARVLLVDDNPASRLTLQTVLEAGGYGVEAAASAAEAVRLLEDREYELVLSDLRMESPEAGLKVLAHARMMDYRPATALVTTYSDEPQTEIKGRRSRQMLIAPEDLPELLEKVADLISERASRKVRREMRIGSLTTA
jgi:CheY-like chemotaxis protein